MTVTAAALPRALTDTAPARERFALTGPSVQVDVRLNAVRSDLADIRLADRVFAPHYAAPVRRLVVRSTALRAGRREETEMLAPMSAGEVFEVLEFAGDSAWGVAPDRHLVGYIDADALSAAPA